MNILYICTHNRCRSILSEAITNHRTNGAITAYSAGSQPVGEVHPLSLKYLKERGVATEGLKSQSWNDFETSNIDLVITVCDSAANETCPVWFGDTAKIHWGLSDPSKLEGRDEEIKAAFFSVMELIQQRIDALMTLDFDAMNKTELTDALNALQSTEVIN